MRGIGAATAATVGSGPMQRAILAFAVVATVLAGLLGMHVLELHGASAAGHGAGPGAVAHAAMGDGGSSTQAANTHTASPTAPSAAGAVEAAPVVDTSVSASVESDGTNGMRDTAGMAMMCVLALLLVALAVRLRRRFVLRIPAPARGSAQRRSLPRLAPRIPDPPTPLLLGISRT